MKIKDLNLPKWLKYIKNDLGIGPEGGDDGDGDIDQVTMLLDGPVGFDKESYTGTSSNEFGRVLASLKGHHVDLLINTLGGRFDQGVAMANQISAHGDVHTCVIGYAASAGAVIHQAGAVRKMMPGTMLMIHPVQGGMDVAGDADDISKQAEAYLSVLRTSNENLIDMLAERSGNSKKDMREMVNATTSMGPDDAKKMGFCDEIVDTSPTWNDLSRGYSVTEVNRKFPKVEQIRNSGGTIGSSKQTHRPIMKLLINALAVAGLLPSADMTDETAIVSAFNKQNDSIVKSRTGTETELESLRNRVKDFEASQKVRVENMVKKAIDDKLVKEGRKDSLIATGLRNEQELIDTIADLQEAKGQATARPVINRGAPPVPPAASGDNKTVDEQIVELQNSLKGKSASEQAIICRDIRKLRGHENIFTLAQPAAK